MSIGRTNGVIVAAALLLASLAPLTSCQREPGKPGSTDAPAAVSPESAAVESPTGPEDVVAEQVRHWECDGGLTLTTKYLPQDNAISLGLHEGERKLPHVAAASGEKYQDDPITFWAKGNTAIYERTPAPQLNCRLKPR
jgi:membrane-bound inhibitor of C-type lysozyme